MTETAVQEKPILFSGAMVRAILEGHKTQTRRVVKPLPSWKPHSVCDPSGAADDWAVWFHFPETKRVGHIRYCPYGKPGDRLWVREASEQVHPCQVDEGRFAIDGQAGIPGPPPVSCKVIYQADGPYPRRHFVEQFPYRDRCLDGCARSHLHPEESWTGWTPSIHMPRWASRLTLEIVNVKVERVQDISEADAIAEGCTSVPFEQWYSGKKPMIDGSSPRQECRGLPPDTWTDIEKLNAYDPLAHTAKEDFQKLWDSINLDRGYGWEKNPFVWAIEFKRLADVTDAH